MSGTELRLESTGDEALDAILGGGIPAQSVVVIAGEPGSGKTILTHQLLFHAARGGKRCLYFTTLSEPAIKVVRYMQEFRFFDAALLEEKITFVDLGAAIRQGADAILAEIMSRVEDIEPAFVAIDSFRSIGELLRNADTARQFVYDLASHTAGWGATTLLVGEYSRPDLSEFPEFAVADGILRLGSERQELTSVRELEVLKMRGAAYVSGRHFFEIGGDGLSVYPRVSAPAPTDSAPFPADARDKTGIEGLDDLLDGGLPKGSATVVQGGTGSGKTTLAMHFLLEGIRSGEKGAIFTFEETPQQLRWVGGRLGWDLPALEKQGLLLISYTSPVELSPDRFLNLARAEVHGQGIRRVVFDSLSTMALGVPSDRRYKELIYAAAKHMRREGASILMTMESQQLLGAGDISGLGVSFIADNLIQIRYVEMGGRLERAISVIKARGVDVNSELRGAAIGRGGMTVIKDRFKDLRGVITGLPSAPA